MSFGEIVLAALVGTIEPIAEAKIEAVLQTLHDSNEQQWKAAIEGGRALGLALGPIVAKTGTKIDDAILTGILEAVEASAAANGYEFSAAADTNAS